MNDRPHEHDAPENTGTPGIPETPGPDTLPPALTDALRALDGPAVMPSAEHDDALLAGARAHLAQVAADTPGAPRQTGGSRQVLAYLGAGGAVAAAAAVAIVFWINGSNPATPTAATLAENNPADSRRPTDDGPNDSDPQTDPGTTARPGQLAGAGDLDGSGTVDILDAFALARAIEDDGPAARSRASDFNNDGRVDPQDADWLANRAVSLGRDGGRG